MWAIIATWRMALEGVQEAGNLLKEGKSGGEAVEHAIRCVEDFHTINQLDMVVYQMKR